MSLDLILIWIRWTTVNKNEFSVEMVSNGRQYHFPWIMIPFQSSTEVSFIKGHHPDFWGLKGQGEQNDVTLTGRKTPSPQRRPILVQICPSNTKNNWNLQLRCALKPCTPVFPSSGSLGDRLWCLLLPKTSSTSVVTQNRTWCRSPVRSLKGVFGCVPGL